MGDINRRSALGLVASASVAMSLRPAFAASFPERPTRMVVPYPPGGPTDIMARVVADFLGRDLKQTCVVDNRGGANGSIGADAVAHAEPDGYTILMTAGSVLTQNPLIYKKLTYDPPKDFRMLGIMTIVPIVIVVRPSLPVKTVHDLVAYAKQNPGKLVYGSAGIGGTTHLAGERFKQAAGIDITHVPYKGSGPALADLLGGHIDMMFDTLSTSVPHIASGAFRAIAMATPERLKAYPTVPTVAESGYSDYVINVWFGVAGAARMADDIAAAWTASLHRAIADPGVRERLENISFVMMPPMDQPTMTKFVTDDRAAWAKVITAQKISID